MNNGVLLTVTITTEQDEDYIPYIGEAVDIFSWDAMGGKPAATVHVQRVEMTDDGFTVWCFNSVGYASRDWLVLPAA